MMENLRARLARAVINRDIEELTKLSIELEDATDCEIKAIRAEALEALGALLLGSDKEIGEKYLKEAMKIAEECNLRKVLANTIGYLLLVDPKYADVAIEKLKPDDPLEGPVLALAYGLKGEHEKAFELIKKHLGTYKAALYGFILTTVIRQDLRPEDLLVDVIWESYRYQTYRGYEQHMRILLDGMLDRKLVGDKKAKVYSIAALLLGPDESLAMQAFKAARDEFIKDFTRIVLAETLIEKNPEMAYRYASHVTPREDPRGAYVTSVAKFVVSRKDVKELFEAMRYALLAYFAGLERKGLSSVLVEFIYASIARTIAFLAYKMKSKDIAKTLEYPCTLVPTFLEYRSLLAKACACAMKVAGEDRKRFVEYGAESFSDDLLDECLS